MDDKIITPDVVAQMFLDRYEDYREGKLDRAVFDSTTANAMLMTVKESPREMVAFYIQAGYMIKASLDSEYGENSDVAVNGLAQYQSVVFAFLIPLLSMALNSNDTLLRNTMPEIDEFEDGPLPVPQGDPSEVFKNIEGFILDEWIED